MAEPAPALPVPQSFVRGQGLIQPARLTEGITGRQIGWVLKDAAAEAESRIAHNLSNMTISGKVTNMQLRAAVAGLAPISTEMWTQVGKVTRAGMFQAGQLAADQAIDRDLMEGMPGLAIVQYAPQIHFEAAHSVESLISRRTNGFSLAERIYANGRVGVRQAARVVERGLVLQRSAKEIARQVRQFYRPDVKGGQSYAAMRLARTEINNAHHETSIRMSKDRPWVRGFKWNLSGSHPRPDICNVFAERDHDGLGAGVYKKEHAPSKPHPQCLCYLTHQQATQDEFIDNLVNGQYDDWLESKGVTC